MNYENPSIQSIGEDEVIEQPLSASVKDVIISTPIESNLLDHPSNGCHWKNIEINNDCIVKSALELDIDPDDDEKITFELDPLEFEEILKNIEVNSEQDIPRHNQHSIKPLRFNKRDPRLSRLFGEKIF